MLNQLHEAIECDHLNPLQVHKETIMTDPVQRPMMMPASTQRSKKKIGWVALNYLDLRYGKPAIIEAKYQQNPFQWLRMQQGEVAVKFVKTDLNDSFPF